MHQVKYCKLSELACEKRGEYGNFYNNKNNDHLVDKVKPYNARM